jgi:hypothetical protein
MDRTTQPRDSLRWVPDVQVGVEHRQAGKILDLDPHLIGRQLLRSAEEGSIERGLAQAPGYSDDPKASIPGNRITHLTPLSRDVLLGTPIEPANC